MIRAFRAEMAGIFRDRQVLMIVVLALAIYGLIYPAPYRPELLRVVPVVAVDLDGGESAREVLRRIDASESVTLAARLTDMAAADRAVQSRDAYGIVLIPQGFERDLLSGRPSPIAVYGDASYFLVYQKVLSGMAIPVRQMGATIAAGRLMAGQQLDAAGRDDVLHRLDIVARRRGDEVVEVVRVDRFFFGGGWHVRRR